MGKKDLTSSATVTYTAGSSDEKLTETVDEQTIAYGEASMTAKLTSSAKGGAIGETVKLTLELKNTGTVDYTDIRVTDPALGDVFTDQSLPAGETLTLEKDITLEATADYKFTVIAADSTGTETQVDVDSLTLTVVDPTQIVHLTLVAAADRTEVYSQPGTVRFTLTITNDSAVEAKDVKITEANTTLYTFASIPAGATRSLTRDASLSMGGKYQFTASTADALGTAVTFDSNEIQIAFSVPTPAPATPTPAAQPTVEPTYAAIPYVPISDPSVGTAPKLIRVFFYPLMIVSGILLIIAAVLLLIATKKRMDEKHASDAALDHLDRAKRRDYIAPNEEAESAPKAGTPAPADAAPGADAAVSAPSEPDAITEEELPHMKYVRNAYQHAGNAREADPEALLAEDAPPAGEPEAPTPDNRAEIYGRPREAEPPPAARDGRTQPETKATLAEELRAYRERDDTSMSRSVRTGGTARGRAARRQRRRGQKRRTLPAAARTTARNNAADTGSNARESFLRAFCACFSRKSCIISESRGRMITVCSKVFRRKRSVFSSICASITKPLSLTRTGTNTNNMCASLLCLHRGDGPRGGQSPRIWSCGPPNAWRASGGTPVSAGTNRRIATICGFCSAAPVRCGTRRPCTGSSWRRSGWNGGWAFGGTTGPPWTCFANACGKTRRGEGRAARGEGARQGPGALRRPLQPHGRAGRASAGAQGDLPA
jgi:hypothetical protein